MELGFTFLPTKIYLGSKNVLLLMGLTWRFGELEFDKNWTFTPDKTLEYTINGKLLMDLKFEEWIWF